MSKGDASSVVELQCQIHFETNQQLQKLHTHTIITNGV
jgi:hypothetical protein